MPPDTPASHGNRPEAPGSPFHQNINTKSPVLQTQGTDMAAEGGDMLFRGLAALWMSLSFIAWVLALRNSPGKDGVPRSVPRWKLSTAKVMGVLVLAIAFVLFLPFFMELEGIPPSYLTVTNASIALFVGVGILMVSRPAPAAAAPGGQSGSITLDSGGGEPVEVATLTRGAVPHPGPVPAPGPPPAKGGSQTITCPQCGEDFATVIHSLPAAIKCPHCGVEGELD